ncbi:MAG: GNAT family N-acetyltransferase [Ignavibacteria bacterium]|jgi:RimJ/RimL family protein N-acetyltransferase|nr:GNAT family N-acetyltransferase [Ignavibacteria bacterium]MCU7504456.1 GNAT family N-acetyltransferase [Ignavibacteria bacterium]MCU7517453.1 GNAT family N-acetyltransferase [Ignavibacteria bacterium]
MRTVKFLEGEKIYLRPVQEKDLELVEYGKNNTDVRETLFLFAPMTQEQVRAEMNAWSGSKEIMFFTICSQADDEPVGQTAFVRIDYVSRAAVFYLAIYDPEFWSKGFGGEATSLMLRYAFEILNMNRIQLHVCCENPKAVKAYEKAGYVIEGTLRQAMYHFNRYIDFYVMSILREEYYNKKS